MIGFACKFISDDKKINESMNCKTTTVKYLKNNDAEKKLNTLLVHNIKAIKRLVTHVSLLPENRRMIRFTSDLLPMYTHDDFGCFYKDDNIKSFIERNFKKIGDFCKLKGIRTSFHPSQFVALSSDRQEVVINSKRDIEYHAYMVKSMGFNDFSECKINIHVSGKKGVDGFRKEFYNLSDDARSHLTVENTENKYCLDTVLELSDIIPIVFDIHHEFCVCGKYLPFTDKRIKDVIKSWNGIKPVMHYSNSKGESKRELRSHSDYLWNKDANQVLSEYMNNFDIMVEAKMKNKAVDKLIKEVI